MGKNLAHINSAHHISTTELTLTYLQGRKEKSKCGYVVRKNLDFDKAEILLYEPLEKMPPFSRKTLVFVSPPGKNLWIRGLLQRLCSLRKDTVKPYIYFLPYV